MKVTNFTDEQMEQVGNMSAMTRGLRKSARRSLAAVVTGVAALLMGAAAAGGQEMPTTEPTIMPATMPTTAPVVAMAEAAALTPAAPTTAPAATKPGAFALIAEGLSPTGDVRLVTGKSVVLTTKANFKRVSIGSPDVADVNPIGPATIMVTAKKPGATQLILWDDSDHSQVIDISVDVDLSALRQQLTTIFPDSKIEVSNAAGSIALHGRVASLQTSDQVTALATPYGKVINFLEVAGGKQVMLHVRFAEMSRSAKRSLGFSGYATDGVTKLGAINGGNISPIGGLATSSSTAVGSGVSLFGGGRAGAWAFEAFLSALRENNLLRVLAEPDLVAISGQEASFLAGGEFPVPVPQNSGGGTSITVDYREFGVKLNFTPVVLGDGRIRLKVNPEVSDLDYSTAVQFQGFVTPGLTKRKVSTTIELADGQTFALAGLLNNSMNATHSGTPLLMDIPILGSLFRSTSYQRKETELVVLVTPQLVEPMNPAQVPLLPGEKWRFPTEGELFWLKDLGGPAADPSKAPNSEKTGPAPFKGDVGYTPVAASEPVKK